MADRRTRAGSPNRSLAQPHAEAAAVLVDESDTRLLEGVADEQQRPFVCRDVLILEISDGDDTNFGVFRQVILRPLQQATGGSALSRCYHAATIGRL